MAPRTTTTKKKSSKPTTKPSSKRPTRPPSTREVADMLGVTLAPPLKPEQTARLRKALPGDAGILDDVAALLAEDTDALNLPDITPRRCSRRRPSRSPSPRARSSRTPSTGACSSSGCRPTTAR